MSAADPNRSQVFLRGEVKLIGQDIHQEVADYLASEYKGLVEFVEVEVNAKVLFAGVMKELKVEYANHISPGDALEVFCEEFGISSPLQDLEKRNGELEIALKELTELKESQNKEEKDPAPPAKKSKRKRGAARTK
jgi:hypothetical protein